MSKPATVLDIFFGFPSYGGNGGISSEHPDIREWWAELVLKMRDDPRIGSVTTKVIGDTPVTMVRNKFVQLARASGAHVLVMVDSDQSPNFHRGESDWKPFFETAFDFLYERYTKGKVTCVGAPYCGPPGLKVGSESVYVFVWRNDGIHGRETPIRLEQYTREEAALMTGIQECAALPTGMIMYDMRCFDLIEPTKMLKDKVLDAYKQGEMTKAQAMNALREGYFYYEWENGWACDKASTEDVQNTRDISLAGMQVLGYNPMFCAWDSWIGHHKPWCVGRPRIYSVESISGNFRQAVELGNEAGERMMEMRSDFWEQYEKIHGSKVATPKDGKQFLADDHVTPQVQLDELQEFVKQRVAKTSGHTFHIVEVGSWKGASAIAMAKADPRVLVTCVDTWQGSESDHTLIRASEEDVSSVFMENVKNSGVSSKIAARRGKSVDVAREWDGGKVDMIFIDANHTYEAVKEDIAAWWPRLMPDGVMIGHDYRTKNFPGVDQAVKEAFGDRVKSYGASQPYGCFWAVEASDEPSVPTK